MAGAQILLARFQRGAGFMQARLGRDAKGLRPRVRLARLAQLAGKLLDFFAEPRDFAGAPAEFRRIGGLGVKRRLRLDFQAAFFHGEIGAQQIAVSLDLVERHRQALFDLGERQPPRPSRNQRQQRQADQTADAKTQSEGDDLFDQAESFLENGAQPAILLRRCKAVQKGFHVEVRVNFK